MFDDIFLKMITQKDDFSKLLFLTEYFLGKPYILGAQGEGPEAEFDQFPLYRFDAFDCLTFVNNVLALLFSYDETSFKNFLLKLNYYQAKATYQNRFHFMSLDWNPQNQRNGFLLDITTSIEDDKQKPIFKMAEGMIDKRNWFLHRDEKDIRIAAPVTEAKLAKLRALSTLFQPEMTCIPYLPIEHLLSNRSYEDQFPDCGVLEIVRPNWDLRQQIGTHLHVSHIGFWLKLPSSEIVFRHASSDKKQVVEINLYDYLLDISKNSSIKGINLQTLRKA